ncbi:MAG: SpoIIE family protein phosphatase [Desulfobacterales bacterium]|jgi:sigma-B regulation protein RsbU (phosphoserine phosphatase)
MFRLKSIQQRLTIFMLLPVALLLIGMGVFGYSYARKSLFNEWREAAILKLQRAAHSVDMRLSNTREWIYMFQRAGQDKYHHIQHEWILEQLERLDGVVRADLIPEKKMSPATDSSEAGHHTNRSRSSSMQEAMPDMTSSHGAHIAAITSPRYDDIVKNKTVSLVSKLIDSTGRPIGRLEVVLNFDDLVDNVVAAGWWESSKAFLVDDSGKILTSTLTEHRQRLAENDDPLEQRTLYGIMSMSYGTYLGKGLIPTEVSGFYKLRQAPWSLVMIAPGSEILAPIVRLRSYYFISGAAFITLILILIRLVTGRMASSIKEVSQAASKIARSEFNSQLLPVKTQDEVGELTRSFNTMLQQLEERLRLKESLSLAMEVQQNLLPQKQIKIEGLDIAGKCIYCDETGGDYFDFLRFHELGDGRIGIAVGDVVGHGIAAALLMTTARALLRCRASQPGGLSEMINDVNRILCLDTSESGSFMTLFFMLIDPHKRQLQWIRAGHDPAIVYNSSSDSFDELKGKGTAIGIDGQWSFQDYHSNWESGQIMLIGTDGIWETRNSLDEKFGKERVQEIIRQNQKSSAQDILQAITDRLATFRQNKAPHDDITLVVIKFVD